MREYLSRLGLIEADSAEQIADRVRDRTDITVWRCSRSAVIFLEGQLDEPQTYYARKMLAGDSNCSLTPAEGVLHATLWQEDDARRARQFSDYIRGKVWLDFGAGEGGLLQIMRGKAARAMGFELNREQCARMLGRGIDVIDNWRGLGDGSLDVTVHGTCGHRTGSTGQE